MLEFVHFTGADGGKDPQTRRKVRSQAMRDYRRRQRQSREASSRTSVSPQPSAPRAANAPHDTPFTQDMLQSQFPTSSRSWSSPPGERNRENNTERLHEHALSVPVSTSAPTFAPRGQYASTGNLQQASIEHSKFQTSAQLPLSMTPPYAQNSIETPDLNMPETATWYDDIDDHFQSPGLINVMFNFCQSYVQWLLPRTSWDIAGKVMASEMNRGICPVVLAACCLASVGHLDAVQPGRPGGNYEFYKARILQEVTKDMASPQTARAHETVSSLALLTSFEMSRCSEEALTHLQGLKALATPRVQPLLETLDLLHAVLFDSSLVMDTYGVLFPTDLDEEAICYKEQAIVFALVGVEHEEAILNSSNVSLIHIMTHYAPVLQSMSAAVLEAIASPTSAPKPENHARLIDTYKEKLEDFHEATCRVDRASDKSMYLAQACYFHRTLTHRVVLTRCLFRREDNQELAAGLHDSIRNSEDALWSEIPYTRLAVLLTGAAVTSKNSHKSYLQAQISKLIYQLGPKEWRRVRNLLVRFIGLRTWLDVPVTDADVPSVSSF